MRVPLAVTVMCLLVSPAYAQLATPNETGLRYGHVHLNVSDIEVHKTLWVEHFGGVVVQKGALTAVCRVDVSAAPRSQSFFDPMRRKVGSADTRTASLRSS